MKEELNGSDAAAKEAQAHREAADKAQRLADELKLQELGKKENELEAELKTVQRQIADLKRK